MRRYSGLSIIEVMVVLVILGVVSLSVGDGLLTSMRANSVADERAAAIRAAREKLDWVVAMKSAILNQVPSEKQNPPTPVYPWFELYDAPGSPNYGVLKTIHFDSNPANDQPGTFAVAYDRKSTTNQPGTQVFLPGIAGKDPGEIVIMFDETAPVDPPATPYRTLKYGRDLVTNASPMSPVPDGQPDGVNFVQIDCDLDGVVGPSGNSDARGNCAWTDPGTKLVGYGRMPVGVIIRWRGSDGQLQRVEQWTVVNFLPQTDMYQVP